MKLYLVTRQDLKPGLRAAQLCHALRAFVDEHPAVDQEWFTKSNTLVLLEVADLAELQVLGSRAKEEEVPLSIFLEPDLDHELTAIALLPTNRHLVRKLPLLFSP